MCVSGGPAQSGGLAVCVNCWLTRDHIKCLSVGTPCSDRTEQQLQDQQLQCQLVVWRIALIYGALPKLPMSFIKWVLLPVLVSVSNTLITLRFFCKGCVS